MIALSPEVLSLVARLRETSAAETSAHVELLNWACGDGQVADRLTDWNLWHRDLLSAIGETERITRVELTIIDTAADRRRPLSLDEVDEINAAIR